MARDGEHAGDPASRHAGTGAAAPRRILAGIDEAGFGPVLGPLVIGATAWHVPDDCNGADLWRRLRGGVTRSPSKRFARLAINDSKKIYSSRKGLADLERGVLGTLAAARPPSQTWSAASSASAAGGTCLDGFARFLDRLAPGWAEQAAEHPWYDGTGELALPVASDRGDLATRANGLRVAMKRSQVAFLGAALEVVLEARYNRLCDAIGNKSLMLFCCTARLIQRLFDRFARDRLIIICDRHGGRISYRRLCQQHWPDLHLSVLEESAQRSGYQLNDAAAGGPAMELWFLPKADATYLPASLASMYCKYTRELFMRLLNRFWRTQVGEGLEATAGYYTDGRRFIRQVADAAQRLGLSTERFVRKR